MRTCVHVCVCAYRIYVCVNMCALCVLRVCASMLSVHFEGVCLFVCVCVRVKACERHRGKQGSNIVY